MIHQIVMEQNDNCFPNSDQILLLKAALLSDETALQAWQEWVKIVNIDVLDWGEARLLPLLYHNLKKNGLPDSQIPRRCKNMYFHTWADNKLLFHHTTKLLHQFKEAEIPTIVLKGAAIASQYYQDYGLRPMSDFDFLVPIDRTEESTEILKQSDWKLKLGYSFPKKFTKDYTCFQHSWSFVNSSKKEIDLHWHVLDYSLALDADLDFWANARSIEIAGIQTLMLDPADQLLHVCTHGASWNLATPIRWVTDAMIILQKYPDLDWQRLLKQIARHRLMLPMQATLEFLLTHLAAPIPIEFLQELSNIASTPQEKYYYQLVTTSPEKRSLLDKIGYMMYRGKIYYCNCKGLTLNTPISLVTQIYNLPNFLQLNFGVNSKWQVPIVVISKILRGC